MEKWFILVLSKMHIPIFLKTWGNVIDIATTAATVAAVNDQGKVFVWGNLSTKGEGLVPETDSKIVSVQGGRYHYTALTEDGAVLSWVQTIIISHQFLKKFQMLI